MHELSIAQNILAIVLEEMDKQNLTRLEKVEVVNGQLAGVVTESLIFAWEAMVNGEGDDARVKGAALEVREAPLILKCASCSHEFSPEHAINEFMPCSECNEQIGHEVLSGQGTLSSTTSKQNRQETSHGNPRCPKHIRSQRPASPSRPHGDALQASHEEHLRA